MIYSKVQTLMHQSIPNISPSKAPGIFLGYRQIPHPLGKRKLWKNTPSGQNNLHKGPIPKGKAFYLFSVIAIYLHKKKTANSANKIFMKVMIFTVFKDYIFSIKQEQIQDKTREGNKSLRYMLQNFHSIYCASKTNTWQANISNRL